jgi:hypothetical protein
LVSLEEAHQTEEEMIHLFLWPSQQKKKQEVNASSDFTLL